MKAAVTLGDTVIEPGTKGHGLLTVPDALPDGSPVEVPFVVFNGAKPGPTLHLQTGLHSFETQGLGAISEVFAELDPDELSGIIQYALPAPLAVAQRLHVLLSWNAQPNVGLVRVYDGNRRWPGTPKGLFFDMALNLVWENMIKDKSDCVIDFHTRGGWAEGPNWVACGAKLSEELSFSYGTEFIMTQSGLLDKPLMKLDYSKVTPATARKVLTLCRVEEQCAMQGIPCFAPEGTAGTGGFEYRKEVNAIDVRGIKNVMKKMGMIEGEIELPKKQYVFGGGIWDESWVTCSKGGFFVSKVNFKQMVKKGDILGGIYSMRTLEEIETLTAPSDGMVFGLPEYPLLNAGESPTAIIDLGKAIKVIENP